MRYFVFLLVVKKHMQMPKYGKIFGIFMRLIMKAELLKFPIIKMMFYIMFTISLDYWLVNPIV